MLLAQVHFFNSFFYDKLRTKGYDGVKRWTKNVSYEFTSICVTIFLLAVSPTLFIQSFKYLLNVFCMLDTVLNMKDMVLNEETSCLFCGENK